MILGDLIEIAQFKIIVFSVFRVFHLFSSFPQSDSVLKCLKQRERIFSPEVSNAQTSGRRQHCRVRDQLANRHTSRL